jgi:hypothetical protein
MKKFLRIVFIVLIVAFLAAQVVRPDRTNPPVDQAKVLQAPADVQAILDRSCNDCHSNRTQWPWYTNVAPVSWFIADHVKNGRKELNFSEFASYTPRRSARKMHEICEQVEKGDMPLQGYVPLHPEAKLSDAEQARLCEWSKSEEARIKAEHPEAMTAPPNAPAGRS